MLNILGRIRKVFDNCDADVIFLMNTKEQDSNFTYLCGFTSGVFENTPLIVARKKLVLLVSVLEYEIAKEQRPKGMEVVKVDSSKRAREIMVKYMKSKTVGINGDYLPYNYYSTIKKRIKPKRLIDVSSAFGRARSVKGSDEIENITVANRIARKALGIVKGKLKAGMTEKEVAAMIDYDMMKMGASGASFDSIVAFNKNTALPHHMPDETKLKENSIVLIDIGAKYNNYCSDITRTFMFRPDPKSARYKRFADIFNTVRKAQKLSYQYVKDGLPGSKAHDAAANYIDRARNGAYKGRFIHSLGHAVGIEVHDTGPGLSPVSKEKLESNMVVSNEPGIYIVGFGGVRLEEDVIVTKKGAKII